MQKINDAHNLAKRYNNQELLTGQEETNYDHIKNMVNDFTPFYELWTTTDLWRVSM